MGELTSPEDEVRTTSRILTFTGHAGVSPTLGLDFALPYVDREHVHVQNVEGGTAILRDFHYSGLGDLLVTGQWMAMGSVRGSRTSLALVLGSKLPSGRREVERIGGDTPEPPARPGTGSVDWIAGAHLMRFVAIRGGGERLPLFVGVQARHNGIGTEGYRVGSELQLSAGGHYPLGRTMELLGQVNLRARARDDVGRTDAFRDNTGGTWLYVSPGLRVKADGFLGFYAYFQVPVYQRVNRIQLVSPYHILIGTTYAFAS